MKTIDLRRLLLALTLTGCVAVAVSCATDSEDSRAPGGHTNWLRCATLEDCPGASRAAGCSDDGYCVDQHGERIPRLDAGASASSNRDASAVGSGTSDASGGAGNTSGSQGIDGSVIQSDASGGAVAGQSSGGSGGTSGCGQGAPGCGEVGAACCDPAPCDGPNFCHGDLSCCGASCRESCSDEIRIPECPGGAVERCASERCLDGQVCLECGPGEVCLEVSLSCGPAGGTTAQCISDPCLGQTLDCSCAQAACAGLDPAPGGWMCTVYSADHFLTGPNDPFMSCSGGGICASPDTPIAGEHGDVPIAELGVGDRVYSLTDEGVQLVPLLAVSRTAVTGHHVLRIELDSGRMLEVSPPHPLADGRRLDALAVDERLQGQRVVAIDRIAYRHAHTYDILPASDTGTYLAAGVWLGSTLAPPRADGF